MNTKKVAIMQPYFFPYIGYWQLISHVDTFVFFDDVQYIRHGWINRNRILKPANDWQYIIVPLEKHSQSAKIRQIRAKNEPSWKDKIYAQLIHYKKIAPHYNKTSQLVMDALPTDCHTNITLINSHIVRVITSALSLQTKFLISSMQNFDYSDINVPGDWALRISQQLNASEYINPISGAELFNNSNFNQSGITLSFLQPKEIVYEQKRPFIPWLSIIDVLMFNTLEETKFLLNEYQLVNAE